MLDKAISKILEESKEKSKGEIIAEFHSPYSHDMMEKAFDFACSTQEETTRFVLETFGIKLDRIITLEVSDADLTPYDAEEHHQDNKWYLAIIKEDDKNIAYLVMRSELRLK